LKDLSKNIYKIPNIFLMDIFEKFKKKINIFFQRSFRKLLKLLLLFIVHDTFPWHILITTMKYHTNTFYIQLNLIMLCNISKMEAHRTNQVKLSHAPSVPS